MNLTDNDRAFLDAHHAAAMITLRADGTPHAVRVGVALVDGMLWSSGTHDRLRTGLLRRDPRCTLFVFDPTRRYLTLETIVTILEGPEDQGPVRPAPEAPVTRCTRPPVRRVAVAPARATTSRPSRNGKKASEATTVPRVSRPRSWALETASLAASTRLI